MTVSSEATATPWTNLVSLPIMTATQFLIVSCMHPRSPDREQSGNMGRVTACAKRQIANDFFMLLNLCDHDEDPELMVQKTLLGLLPPQGLLSSSLPSFLKTLTSRLGQRDSIWLPFEKKTISS